MFDLDSGTIALDAVLFDSKLCGRFVLTGAAAFRRAKGEGFALAVGGFHPRFRPPTRLPRRAAGHGRADQRRQPEADRQAYFAITSNTVQFGARASLYAAACGFSIEGYVGFDVLIQLWPPHFLAEFRASVQLKRGRRNLFKVSVRGTLEGPFPLRVAGKATFGILWWDYTVGFDRTLIGGSGDVVTETLDVVTEVVTRLNDPASWRSELPPAAEPARRAADRPDRRRTSSCTRSAASRCSRASCRSTSTATSTGSAPPSRPDARRFAVTSAAVGGSLATTDPVCDDFPDGQFFDLTDDERLAAPSFVRWRPASRSARRVRHRRRRRRAVAVRLHRDHGRPRRRAGDRR